MDEETPKPSIDPESPRADTKRRRIEFMKLLPKQDRRTYYMVNKFRKRQRVLLDMDDIEDPDPFYPTYIFYCFQGKNVN